MWRKGNPHLWLAGLKIGGATIENSMAISQKVKIELSYSLAIPLLGIYPKSTKTFIWKAIYIPVFIAALFTIAKLWKQPKCPSKDEGIKNIWYMYTVEDYSAIKQAGNPAVNNNMDGLWSYSKWNKSDRKRQIPYDFNHMWNLKIKQTRQKQTQRSDSWLLEGKEIGSGWNGWRRSAVWWWIVTRLVGYYVDHFKCIQMSKYNAVCLKIYIYIYI